MFQIERHLKTLYTFYEAINSFTNILARVLSIHVCTSTWVMAFVMRMAPTILDQNRLVSIQNGRQIEFKYCSNLTIVDHFTASMLLAFVPSHERILLLFMFPIIFCSIFSLFNANINFKMVKIIYTCDWNVNKLECDINWSIADYVCVAEFTSTRIKLAKLWRLWRRWQRLK